MDLGVESNADSSIDEVHPLSGNGQMRTIAPALINHAPRTDGEGTAFALAAAGNDAPVIGADQNIAATVAQQCPLSAPATAKSLSVETLRHVEWMRPPEHAVPQTTNRTGITLVKSEHSLAHVDAGIGVAERSDRLDRYVEALHRRHGISEDAALAIALAALSAAAGACRTLRNPLGGTVSTALNVVVEDPVNARVGRAADQALRPFQRQVEKKIAAHQEKGPKHLRQLRMELDQECARVVSLLRSPPEKAPEPLTIPVPAAERKKEASKEAVTEAKQAAERIRLFEFEERPFLMVDGLAAKDIPVITQRTFDCALLNFSPNGDGLRQLDVLRPTERREVLRYLVAAWHGKPFGTGGQTILNPSVTNLWLLDAGDIARAWRAPAIVTSGLLETFLVVANDTPADVDIESFTTTAADDDWRDLIDVVLGERIMGDACEHQLAEGAVRRFLQFHADTAQAQRADTRKFTAWWPEQVLKVALLLHLDSVHDELPNEIGLATLEAAISIVERLGAAQLRVIAAMNSPRDHLETEIEVMTAKIRINGPLSKWNLFRRYHVQRAEVMEPILARCCERNLLRVEDDLVRLADAEP